MDSHGNGFNIELIIVVGLTFTTILKRKKRLQRERANQNSLGK